MLQGFKGPWLMFGIMLQWTTWVLFEDKDIQFPDEIQLEFPDNSTRIVELLGIRATWEPPDQPVSREVGLQLAKDWEIWDYETRVLNCT